MRSLRTPLVALAAITAVLEAVMIGGLGSSYSVFKATTANGANSFTAAATFPPSGTLFSVGANANGQLGLGDTSIHYSPVEVNPDQWMEVSGGASHACGVEVGGNLFCWGSNSSGQLGVNNNNEQHSPVAPLTSTNFSMAVGGSNFSCAVRADGSLWCWGDDSSGQVGNGSSTGQVLQPVQIGSATWETVTAGQSHACGIQTGGTLWCWGANGSGQLGQGNNTTAIYSAPTQVGVDTTWTSVSAGFLSTCATKSDGTLWCWGDNAHTELGLGNTTPEYSPTQVAGTTWNTVSMGQYTACAIKTDNTLWCWGENSNGEVGIGNTTPQSTPAEVTTATNWKTISLGYQHTCATRTDKTAWCWGNNTNGQLGLNNTSQKTYPWQAPFKTVEAISAGSQSNSTYIMTKETGIETNLAIGKTMSESSEAAAGYTDTMANDGDPYNTYWESGGTLSGTPVWLEVDLGASTSVGRIVLTTPELSTWLARTETMSIQASNDNVTFTDVVPSAGYTFDPATGSIVTITFAPVSYRYWRLNITNTDNASAAGQISEFQLYTS